MSRLVSTTVAFTATGTGGNLDDYGSGTGEFGMQVKGTGAAATTWSVALQVSLDNVNWTTILTHANADVDGTIKYMPDSTERPALFMRLNCTSLTLGAATNIVVTLIAKAI